MRQRLVGIAGGWMAIGAAYVMLLWIGFGLYGALSGMPWDRDRLASGWMIGTIVTVVPYMLGGMYYALSKPSARGKGGDLWWIAVVPAIGEKAAIYGAGALFVAAGGDGGGDGHVTPASVFQFVSAEALPYYRPSYLLSAAAGIAICVAVGKLAARSNRMDADAKHGDTRKESP